MIKILKNYLIIIHADKPELLTKFRDKATHWLPEFSYKPTNDIYQPPNVICTTKATTFNLLKALIQDNKLSNDKVIWIDGTDQNITICYTFDLAGDFNNFFRL